MSHLSPAHRAAAGLHADPSLSNSFSATQGAWRFYGNENVTLPRVAAPLRECARLDIPGACDEWMLIALDWCNLHYAGHHGKADRVGHFRQRNKAGWNYLVRADDERLVMHDGQERKLAEVAALLKRGRAFNEVRPVEFHGKPAEQFIAETPVVLHRPARTHRVDKKTGKRKHKNIAGPPLPPRLIVSEVRDDRGRVLARWLLLTNLPATVPAATVALWYYWRWRIESYHKLLKSAGQEIECWQQETPEALSRRLTVAAMACVVVWRLARDTRPEAAELRNMLIRLSGRQMKRGKKHRGFTEPALLAGLGVLIPMLLLLQEYDGEDLRRLAAAVLPGIVPSSGTRSGP